MFFKSKWFKIISIIIICILSIVSGFYLSKKVNNKDEVYESANEEVIVHKDTNENKNIGNSIVSDDQSANKNSKTEEVGNFIKESNYRYFQAINERDISIVEGYYSQNDGGRQLLKEAKYSVSVSEKANAYFELCDYKVQKVEKIADNIYEITYAQSYMRIANGSVQSWSDVTNKDTVIAKNGKFYIDKYESIYEGTFSEEPLENNLTE